MYLQSGLLISTQPKVFRYKNTGFFRKNPVFLKTLHPKIYVALLIYVRTVIVMSRQKRETFHLETADCEGIKADFKSVFI